MRYCSQLQFITTTLIYSYPATSTVADVKLNMGDEADLSIKSNVSPIAVQNPSVSGAFDHPRDKDRILRRGDLARIIGL